MFALFSSKEKEGMEEMLIIALKKKFFKKVPIYVVRANLCFSFIKVVWLAYGLAGYPDIKLGKNKKKVRCRSCIN